MGKQIAQGHRTFGTRQGGITRQLSSFLPSCVRILRQKRFVLASSVHPMRHVKCDLFSSTPQYLAAAPRTDIERGNSKKSRNVAVVLFDAVELLDVTSAFQVLHAAREDTKDRKTLSVFSVADQKRPLLTEAGVTVIPRYSIESAPKVDVLIVPGGIGARTAAFNEGLMRWIKETAAKSCLVVSLSTGALLLGKAGLLNGLEVTTNTQSCNLLKQVARNVVVKPDERFVDAGRVVTGGGGAASVDTCLYLVGRVFGSKHAEQTAKHMNYASWDPAWTENLSL